MHTVLDEVWFRQLKEPSSVQLPYLRAGASDDTTSRMVTGVVPVTTPPTLKLEIKKFNMPRWKMIMTFSYWISIFSGVFFVAPFVAVRGRLYMLLLVLAIVIGIYFFLG